MRLRFGLALFVWMICLACPFDCAAGGILHVFAPEVDGRAYAVARPTVVLSRSHVTISESHTEWRIEQTFYNNDEFPVRGIYLLPLAKMELRGNPEVSVDLIDTPCELLTPDRFLPELKELTILMNDPSLLGLAGQQILVVRQVIIGPRQHKSFRVRFTSRSSLHNDLLDIQLPLDGERYALAPVGELEVRVRLKLARTIRAVFSRTHHASIVSEAPHRCLATVGLKDKRVRKNFRLLAFLSGEDLDMRLLTSRSVGRKGAFLALLVPPLIEGKTGESDRDIVFLLDTSGSMGAEYLEIAKSSLVLCLERLRPGDRLNVLTVGTRVGRLSERLVPANEGNIKRAAGFVNSAETGGGTDLYNGLIMALEQFSSKRRPCIIIMAGDGRGSVGITDPTEIIEDFRRCNKTQARFFALALGKRSDAVLLDRLSSATRGICIQVSEDQEFESAMNRLLAAVSPPTASELNLTFEGVSTDHVMPQPIPDMFGQGSIMVLGRYSRMKEDTSRARLRARIRGSLKTVPRRFTLSEAETDHAYIPALWAMRRLALLIERDRLKGLDEQAKAEISQLAQDFGFRVPRLGGRHQAPGDPQGSGKDSGELLWALKTSTVPEDVQSDSVRHVNGRVFRRQDDAWVDTLYLPIMQTTKVDFLGREFFSLLRQNPELGPYLALGPRVTFVHGESAVAVRSMSENSVKLLRKESGTSRAMQGVGP